MTIGIFGAFAGGLMGALLGGALFGPYGAGVGLVVGGLVGHLSLRFFNAGFVQEAAKRPYVVTCPDCKEPIKVYLEPEEARTAAMTNSQYRVRECSRWKGQPGCERQCENQIIL